MGLDDYDMEQFDTWCEDMDGDLSLDNNGHVHSCYIGDGTNVRVESHGAFRVDDKHGDVQTKLDTDLHEIPLADSVRRQGELLSIGRSPGSRGAIVNVSPPRD